MGDGERRVPVVSVYGDRSDEWRLGLVAWGCSLAVLLFYVGLVVGAAVR